MKTQLNIIIFVHGMTYPQHGRDVEHVYFVSR